MSSISTHFDELELIAEKAGELNDRVGKIENELGSQTKTLDSAALVLDAAIKGLGALKSSVLENDLGALQLALNDKTAHLGREIVRCEMALAEIDRRAEASDGEIKIALEAMATELRGNLAVRAAELTEWSGKVELAIAEHAKALAALPTVIKGADAVGFNPIGEWNAALKFMRMDLVEYMGSSFVSNVDYNTDKPGKSPKWTTIARRAGSIAMGGVGDFGGLSGIAKISQGGTGQNTAAAGARALLEGIGATQGQVLYRSGTQWMALATGTDGQFLKTKGAAANPEWATPLGAGDMVGPGVATNNAIVRFDDTTGKLVQDSAALVDDAGVVTAPDYLLGTAGPSVKSSLAARAPAQGLVFDGTAGVGVTFPIWTSDMSFVLWGSVVSLANYRVILSNVGNTLQLALDVAGKLVVFDVATASFDTGIVAGKAFFMVVTRDSAGWKLSMNGGAYTASAGSIGIAHDVATKIGATSSNTAPWIGPLAITVFNRALSAAEVLALYETGAPVARDFPSGGAGQLTPTFSLSGGATGTQDAVSGNVTFGGGYATYLYAGRTLAAGCKVRVSFTVDAIDGVVQLNQAGAFANYASFTTTGAKIYEVTLTAASTGLYFTNGTSMQYSGLTITPLGLLLAPDPHASGSGLKWYDTSGNLAHITLPATGVAWALPAAPVQLTNGVFAGIYVHDGAYDHATVTAYTQILAFAQTGGANGLSNGLTPDKANNKITTVIAGTYRIAFSVSLTCSVNTNQVTVVAFADGNEVLSSEATQESPAAAAGKAINITGFGYWNVGAGKDIILKFKSAASATLRVLESNVIVERVGQ